MLARREHYGVKKIHFIVTAGPTREYLDPVRFLSNPSTGRMGFAVARAAASSGRRTREDTSTTGARVTLVAGPVVLKTPKDVARIDVVSAREMLAAVKAALAGTRDDERAVIVSTAAIADWRPAKMARRKLKKSEMTGTLKLVRNPDILRSIRDPKAVKVGFAAETGKLESEARRKCAAKRLAFIVANDVSEPGSGFGTATDRATFFFADGSSESLPLMTKRALATRIVRRILKIVEGE